MSLSPLLPIILIISIIKTTSIDAPCDGNFCPPTMLKTKFSPYENTEHAPVFLGKDATNSCTCRTYPERSVVCFGRSICKHLLKQFNITTPLLKITGTLITELKPGDFQFLQQLQALQVEGNFNLSAILPGTFDSNLTKLTNLSISFNPQLRTLDPHSFDGLVNLRILFLVNNGHEYLYDITPALSSRSLPNLFKLMLNVNSFVNISKNDFAPMANTTLQELSLTLCQLEFLHPECFLPLKNLHVIRIGENTLNADMIADVIEKAVQAHIPLKSLNLFSVGFRKSPPKRLMEAIAKSNISNLNLARNRFEEITSETFPYMPNLQILDLRDVLALEIANDAFSNLPNLKTLLLSGNKLTTIPKGVLLDNLTYLDLQQNSGKPFYPSYFSVSNGIFSNMKKLLYLSLNFNKLSNLSNTSFLGLVNLKTLGLKNATIYHIQPGTFASLVNLTFLNLENNYFVVNNSPVGLEVDVFKGLEKLQVILLGGCGISHISQNGNPFTYLRSLKHLGLERNKLKEVSSTDFSPLLNLETIDLSDNLITPWSKRVFTENIKLKSILLNRNKISLLSEGMLDDFAKLTELELQENIFVCDCQTFAIFEMWHLQVSDSFLKILDPKASCAFPEIISNYSIKSYLENAHNGTIPCNLIKYENKQLVVVLPLVLLLLFFVVLASFVYYYRWHIRYWIFLTRLYLSRKGKIKPKTDKQFYTNYAYDAFVSYSNEDRNFVVRLVSMLENYDPFLKLCVYERDFQIGTIISESVLESVARSRKTLLVISDNYAKSQWCRWESQIAEHHRLFFENENGEYVDDTLVLVKLGPVNDNHLTPTLKYLLKTRIYLQWEVEERKQKVFWEKLRGALAPPKHEQALENTHI